MAITLVPMVCPQCGASIDVPVDKDECFCTYCGTKILINNENVRTININKTTRTIDDAKIAESGMKKLLLIGGVILVILMAVMFIMGNTLGGGALLLISMFALLAFVPGERDKQRAAEIEKERLRLEREKLSGKRR